MAPALVKNKEIWKRGKKLTKTATTSWSLFTMPGICPAATGNECSNSHEAQLTPFNTTGGVYKTLSPFLLCEHKILCFLMFYVALSQSAV